LALHRHFGHLGFFCPLTHLFVNIAPFYACKNHAAPEALLDDTRHFMVKKEVIA
jgi:hypothetical protein